MLRSWLISGPQKNTFFPNSVQAFFALSSIPLSDFSNTYGDHVESEHRRVRGAGPVRRDGAGAALGGVRPAVAVSRLWLAQRSAGCAAQRLLSPFDPFASDSVESAGLFVVSLNLPGDACGV